MQKKLCKSNDKILAGCLGGIAEYFGWEPTLLRIIYSLFTLFSAGFPGIIFYLLLFFIMPQAQENN